MEDKKYEICFFPFVFSMERHRQYLEKDIQSQNNPCWKRP